MNSAYLQIDIELNLQKLNKYIMNGQKYVLEKKYFI